MPIQPQPVGEPDALPIELMVPKSLHQKIAKEANELKRADGEPSDWKYVAMEIWKDYFRKPVGKRRKRTGKGQQQKLEAVA